MKKNKKKNDKYENNNFKISHGIASFIIYRVVILFRLVLSQIKTHLLYTSHNASKMQQ